MKTKISLVFVLAAFLMKAQFNNTYDVNNNNDYLFTNFCIGSFDEGSISLSYGLDLPSTPRLDYFILTKHDASGNVIFNERIYPSGSPNDGLINGHALLETRDNGILVAGYIYDMTLGTTQPIVTKVDMNGNFLWSKIYNVNVGGVIGSHMNKISLARVEDDEDENYFVVSASQSDQRPANDIATNVTKIKSDGTMIWSKKYYDVNLFGNPYGVVRDYPGDITFSPDDRMYMITGWRQQWIIFQDNVMYFYGIDKDGNMMTQFKTLTAEGYPFGQDMVYDPNNRVFAVTFTHGNTNFAGPGVASGIGLVTIDAGLNIFLQKFYWNTVALENYGLSISLSQTNGDYVIGSRIYEDIPLSRNNPAFLKVDNTGNPLWFKRYNIADEVIAGHHCQVNTASGLEQYIIIGENANDMRVIRTDDLNGKACGFVDYKPKMLDFAGQEELFDYYPKEGWKYVKYEPPIEVTDVKYRKCKDPGTSYRESNDENVTGIGSNTADTESGIAIYPALISAENAQLTIANTSDNSIKVEVVTVTGQVVFSEAQVPVGTTLISISKSSSLAEGIYIARFYNSTGSFAGSSKFIIAK